MSVKKVTIIEDQTVRRYWKNSVKQEYARIIQRNLLDLFTCICPQTKKNEELNSLKISLINAS